MTGLLVCLSAAALGVDYGWQPVAGGGIEYIIQIEPQMLDALKEGEDVSSALPPAARGIRRYRIVVGNAPLPHHGEPLPIDVGKENDGALETRAAEVSPVRYDRFAEDDAAAPKLSMPLESPYPHDYEAAGVPLPGPAHSTPFARSWPASIVAEPSAPGVAAEEPEETSSPPVDQPPVERNGPSFWTADAKPTKNYSPLRKPQDATTVKRQPSAESTQPRTAAADKPSPGERKEPLSPSDEPPPKNEEHVSDQTRSAALVGLFASLGGNAFLIWVATGQRSRYRSLLRRSHEAIASAGAGELPRADDDSPRWEEVAGDDDSADG